jgi:bifunctional N-acetylglucosamine-1-phosphate-uridyltransferase/glucosamine-1-phosphate-acetyltransferase GlmU-like protein
MDAVILAAGKGSRLEGVMAPYHKPLMVVNGRPIIWTAVHHALQVGANLVTVVVAPENALPISQVLMEFEARLQLLVQQKPRGPGDALYKALNIAHKGSPTRAKTLVLMGDNVTSFADIQKINQIPDFAVGVQLMDREEASRFTFVARLTNGRDYWLEGLTPTEDHVDEATGMVVCWVGPFVVPSDRMMAALEQLYRDTPPEDEIKIGPAFNHVGLDAAHIATQTTDIGTIDFAAKMTPWAG